MTTIWDIICHCDKWGCPACYPIDVPQKPQPVQNAWSSPIQILGIELEYTQVESTTTDGYWTIAKKQDVLDGWTEVKRMKDKVLVCKHCQDTFLHTVYQQKKYRERGWKQPKICKPCSHKRHNQKA